MEDARGRVPTTTSWDVAIYRSIFHLAILHDRRFGLDAPLAGIRIVSLAIKALRPLVLCIGQSNFPSGVAERPLSLSAILSRQS